MVGLLDVNMLIALAWPSHVHHRTAQAWFAANASAGWATCAHTQCAFVRISSNSRIIKEAVTPREALALLRTVVKLEGHAFWAGDLSILDDRVPSELLVGHRQVSDAYLVGLAILNGGRLVTLDRGLPTLLPKESPHRSAVLVVDTAEAPAESGNPEGLT